MDDNFGSDMKIDSIRIYDDRLNGRKLQASKQRKFMENVHLIVIRVIAPKSRINTFSCASTWAYYSSSHFFFTEYHFK